MGDGTSHIIGRWHRPHEDEDRGDCRFAAGARKDDIVAAGNHFERCDEHVCVQLPELLDLLSRDRPDAEFIPSHFYRRRNVPYPPIRLFRPTHGPREGHCCGASFRVTAGNEQDTGTLFRGLIHCQVVQVILQELFPHQKRKAFDPLKALRQVRFA